MGNDRRRPDLRYISFHLIAERHMHFPFGPYGQSGVTMDVGTDEVKETGDPNREIAFPMVPRGWYYICPSFELRSKVVGYELGRSNYVAFRDGCGRAVVLDARCAHMGADLAKGHVAKGILHCPLHDWQYGGDGRCVRIPASTEIPPFAVQTSYPVAEIGGHVVFYNAPVADFPMPFFEACVPDDLCPAEPFDLELKAPWYLVGANGFDVQHFRVAHDRTLIDAPAVDSPAPFAQRMAATYEVTGKSFRDSLIRKFAGPQVHMSVTSWGGVNILVTARFQRAVTRGMVFVRAVDVNRTVLRTIVWVPQHRGPFGALIDPIAAAIRRRFIQAFLADDAARSDGARYNPATLIDADREMKRYLDWLAALYSKRSDAENVQSFQEGAV
jgi:phenylpropionate dioxygenase-like ring-hydroxylating dioxygenase large terminal subunit